MKNYPVSRQDNLVIQEMDGEVLIYDLSENKAFCLNETSALIWQACDGTKSTAEISEFISQKLNSPANEDLVWLALEQLKKEKLLENSNETPNYFIGMSRREVIKKVGLGSMIALPIVASLVAPSSVHAQSCSGSTGLGGACATNSTCMSCCCGGGTCQPFGTLPNGSPCSSSCQCNPAIGACMANGMCGT